ncbi:hypothetical protein VNO77_00099 [Canavalia gladiata]|uniref:Uncharacterized protein n=1 Tax=Canavalia gladiata TaxID=3824 RepID=A0AAN9R120_CANGL
MSGRSGSEGIKSHDVHFSVPWNWNDNECDPGIWHEALLRRASDITLGSDQMHSPIQPEDSAAPKEQHIPPVKRKKVSHWTKDEHRLFLIGLKKYGKGDWKNIARCCVMSKTSVQVGSHAQKYFLRHKNNKKKRTSIHDITLEHDNMIDHHLIPDHNGQHNPIERLSKKSQVGFNASMIPDHNGQHNPVEPLSKKSQMVFNASLAHRCLEESADDVQMHQFPRPVEHHNLVPPIDDGKLRWVLFPPHLNFDWTTLAILQMIESYT